MICGNYHFKRRRTDKTILTQETYFDRCVRIKIISKRLNLWELLQIKVLRANSKIVAVSTLLKIICKI